MKQLNITFEDKEFSLLEKAKGKANMTWHDLILKWARREIDEPVAKD